MSTYEYMTGMSSYDDMMGLGTNGNMIELGPPMPPMPEIVEVGPSVPGFMSVAEYDAFIAKLKAEKGPFIFIGKESPEGKKFINWMALYEPSFMEWFMKLTMIKMYAAGEVISEIPEWVMGEMIQIRKNLYDMYVASTARVKNMLVEQGSFPSTSIPLAEIDSFMSWWKTWDMPGAASLVAMYTVGPEDLLAPEPPKIEIPKKLYDFWKTTEGKIEPPKPLLGFKEKSWLDWALDNWLWIAFGTAGGAVLGGWLVSKRIGMSRNPLLENMREGWGQTVKLKSGTYDLHPILTESYIRGMKAMNMRNAKKFRVTSKGKSLGELHKSSGRYNWRARSYYGVEKYGNSRAALLAWLKDKAPVESLAQREAELMEGVHIPMPVANRKH